MRYRIIHTTRFEYLEPAHDSQNELRMRPWDRAGQRCAAFEINVSEPSSIVEYEDFFGNRAHSVSVSGPHRELKIVANSIVEVDPPAIPSATGVTLVEFLRDDAVRNNIYCEYLSPSEFIPFSERLRKFFWMARPQEQEDIGAYVMRIVAYVRDQFEYETRSTHVHSSLNDILNSGGGVCQDFAHLTIGILRLAGVPARYVSGYLAPVSASAGLDITAQASHAWLEAWLPGLGWCGYDPTHRCAVDARHIVVAIGRDYADVPPLRGVYRNGGGQSLMTVNLRVEFTNQGGPASGQSQQ